ncbi:MAG: hypothetical protein JRJ00_14570 [Deltaproteobacteria bacterium]|nr:hypothetical protein [Deltaproteobacteria bacterium]
MTLIVNAAINIHVSIGVALIAILIYFSSFSDYLYEITHNYDGPVEAIVTYLNQNGKKDDLVAITYGDLPVKFYTDMRVVGGLTGEDLSVAKEADWVIIRRHLICEKDRKVKEYLIQNISWNKYHAITLDCVDIPFENRAEPREHRYRTVTTGEKVTVFRKIQD